MKKLDLSDLTGKVVKRKLHLPFSSIYFRDVSGISSSALSMAYEAYNDMRFREAASHAFVTLKTGSDNVENSEKLNACWIVSKYYSYEDRYDELSGWLRKVIILGPWLRDAYFDLGICYEKSGMVWDAAKILQRCMLISPNDGEAKEKYICLLQKKLVQASTGLSMGTESARNYSVRMRTGFFQSYLSGQNILDIGYGEDSPVFPHAIGIGPDYPEYDGLHLPFDDESQDGVYSSHCLEYIETAAEAIREWFRVLRVGGHMVLMVPHQHLYEKKQSLPSNWNRSHRLFFTPAKLMSVIEEALVPNHYRLRHLVDNDSFYDYNLPAKSHSTGCSEIELVIQKISPPAWELS